MSTPRKKRRYSPRTTNTLPSTSMAHGISDDRYAIQLASIIVQFEHVESMMPRVHGRLMGTIHTDAAGHIYRSLRNPNIRFDILRTLLERSKLNKDRGDEYDKILADYNAARTIRNEYAHGLWYTGSDGVTYLARSDDDGFAFFDAKPEPIEALEGAVAKIMALMLQIVNVAAFSSEELQQLNNPQQP